MKPKIAVEMDDFSPRNSSLNLLEEIKEHYPSFQATLFLVPWEIRFGEPTPITQEEFLPWVNAVKKNQDWLQIGLHGLTHLPEEFGSLGYLASKQRIETAEKMLQNRGIRYEKIFKAPCWSISEEAERACADLGFKVVKDGYYNWNLKDEFPKELAESGVPIIAHGHIQNVCGNGLEESMGRILSLPTEVEFVKLSEII